jgi:hypothetical protein
MALVAVALTSYRYRAAFWTEGWLPDRAWQEKLQRELERIGGHNPQVEATTDGFEIAFVIPANDRPDALWIGESVMRTVGPGGFWQGTSEAVRL